MKFKSFSFLFVLSSVFIILFFPKDAFALTISNVQFLDNSNNVTATYTKSDIDNGNISKDPFLATKMRFNFTNSGLKSSNDYNFTSNFDLAGNRVFDTIFTSRLYSGSSQQTQSYKWMLLSTDVVNPVYNGHYSFNTNWTNNNTSQDMKIEFDLGGEIIVYSFRLNQAKLLSDGENVGDSINNQTQELLDNQNKNQQQTNDRLDNIDSTLKDNFNTCRTSKNLLNPSNLTSSITKNGITLTNNGDGTFNLKGKSTAGTNFVLYTWNYLSSILVDNNYYGLYSNFPFSFSVNFYNNSGTKYLTPNNSPVYVTIRTNYGLNLWFNEGTSVDYENVQIMLYKGNTRINYYEPYGDNGKICVNKMDETNEKLDNIDKTLNDDNISGSKDKANSFFKDFKTDDFGLSGIITAPLSTIKSITSVSCSPLVLPLPFVNENLTLPCIRSIFEEHFSSLLLIYQTITTGILSYYIIVRLFNLVKDFKNPEHDEIEVMDL